GGARKRSTQSPTPFQVMASAPRSPISSSRRRGREATSSRTARASLQRGPVDLTASCSQPQIPARLPYARREEREVPGRDEMDGDAHQGRLDDAPALERAGQVLAREAVETRPQADVARRRVLGLQPAHLLEGPRY